MERSQGSGGATEAPRRDQGYKMSLRSLRRCGVDSGTGGLVLRLEGLSVLFVPVRLDWSIMGCTIRLRALINLGSDGEKKKKKPV